MKLELCRCWTDWYPGVNARFKRLACAWHADREAWAMSSPRNAVGPNDTVWVSDGAALAAQIGEELARPDEVET